MLVTNLFLKHSHGRPLQSVDSFDYGTGGIRDNVACAPFRQVLIASQSVTTQCGLLPGDLRENIVVDFDALHELASGTVVQIGQALVRLTFHCEPCKKILKLVPFDRIAHKRGVLGSFLTAGTISVGDRFSVTEQKFEEIPYAVSDRIRWFLKARNPSAAAVDLVHSIGLPVTSVRAVPGLLRKLMFGRA
jgi:MOSC domain-containing protein YiiM